ncbi:DNA circularization protein [Enterobacter cloacae]
MSWADNLQDASFRGVKFDVKATSEQISRDRAEYKYPNVDGADLKDLGRNPRPFRLTAFLWGPAYEYQLQALTAALDMPGDGELIHPIYGSVPSVIVTGYGIEHDAENVDSCTVEINFLENRTGTALFNTPLPELFGSELFALLDELTDAVADFFEQLTDILNTINGVIKHIKTVESTLINTLLTFENDVSHTLDELVDLAGDPAQFIHELSDVLTVHTANIASRVPALALSVPQTVIGLSAAAPVAASATTVITSWGDIARDMDALVALPESLINGDTTPTIAPPVNSSQDDVQDVKAAYSVLAVAELAGAACSILSDDTQSDLLTPDDIDRLVADVRIRAQAAIDFLRSRYESTRADISATPAPVGISWLNQVDLLKSVALKVQTLGLLVLSRRPPLTRKQVQADSCLRLLAHLWYGDHARCDELQRLNPQIREPNAIQKGAILNAYAK